MSSHHDSLHNSRAGPSSSIEWGWRRCSSLTPKKWKEALYARSSRLASWAPCSATHVTHHGPGTLARLGALVATALLLAAHTAADPAANGVATYVAEYRVEYRGRFVGRSEMSVSYDEEGGIYIFESHTRARGLLRLFAPGPVTETSHFVHENGEIRPLEFWLDDGTRRGEDNLHIAFDWNRGVAVATNAEGETELSLRPGVLDRASMQVAVMHDMATPEGPDRYVLADGDSLRTYEYTAAGEETISTRAGEFRAEGFVQRREGSSRTLTVWGAPELEYLAVRIEQHRDGELQTAAILESVTGLDGASD